MKTENKHEELLKCMRDLIEEECMVIRDVKNKTMSLGTAKEISNAAGKIINACKAEIEYRSIVNRDWVIPFLENDLL